jgi:hypothetical protein
MPGQETRLAVGLLKETICPFDIQADFNNQSFFYLFV